jgi:hypothetical protein
LGLAEMLSLVLIWWIRKISASFDKGIGQVTHAMVPSTWVRNIIQVWFPIHLDSFKLIMLEQSFVYVENCSLAHLLYEQRLLELADNASNGLPDIGGQAFNISDPNPPIAFGDMYTALTTLVPQTRFRDLPPVLMLAVAHAIEAYYVFRLTHPIVSWILPKIKVLFICRVHSYCLTNVICRIGSSFCNRLYLVLRKSIWCSTIRERVNHLRRVDSAIKHHLQL